MVYGNKDGMGLTLDVLVPEKNSKHLGVILVSSGSWKSRKSDVLDDEIERRTKEHWLQGLLKGGYTVFVTRHGSARGTSCPKWSRTSAAACGSCG